MGERTDWTDNRKFAGLLKRAVRIAVASHHIQSELTEAFEARYGCTYSDVDADQLIDMFDYGSSNREPSVAFVDKQMADNGAKDFVQ
ncbi:MAG: hypothetical protein MJH10_20355 [Epibacterium sp.]|nr:hypothetical protein [Epibacterium sp.]NQX75822.1 hypothetical protein [Epibacterium sp.]